MPPLFVVGCHRSGTTLLRRILCTHPEVWLAKETQYLAYLELRDGDWHRERTPAEIADHVAFARGFLGPIGWRTLPDPDAFAASGEVPTLAGVYRWICGLERPPDRDRARIWGDNTPRYVSLIPQLDRAFPDARYLHVVRDPRDVVRSALAVPFGGNTALTAAAEWVERVGAGLSAERLVGERLMCVRFEDLLREPGPVVARIGAWLGVGDGFAPDDVGGDAADVARLPHLRNIARPLDASVVGRWREDLTARQLADVEQLCQPFLAALGYPLDAWRPSWNPTPRFARHAEQYARSLAINLWRGARRRIGR